MSSLVMSWAYSRPFKTILAVLGAIGIASFTASFDSLLITDRERYIVHFVASDQLLFRYLQEGIIPYMFNEPLWRAINYALSGFFLDPVDAIRFYVFFGAFITSYVVLSYDIRYFLLVLAFLLLPQVLKNYISHLRQGVAISVFLFGWLACTGRTRVFVMMLAPFIHASFFFLIFIYISQKILAWLNISIGVRMLLFFFVIIAAGAVSLGAADILGARQAEARYSYFGADVSGRGFIFWIVVFALYVSQGRVFIEKNLMGVSILLFYLATYLFLPTTARIFESGLLLVLLAALNLSPGKRLVFVGLYAFYFFMQWYPRLGIEGLGWVRWV